ncbi:MAG: mannose-6-phosphate isomerase, partial [Clostridiales bacterium]|nr:mannose-6-phosphate isomerase [Clostridiales bacterium]
MEIIFLEPVFKEMPWGGNNLRQFGFNTDLKNIGEAWCISAHEKGDCIIKGGKYDGLRLSGLYQKHRGLFGDPKTETFPLLIKMIDAEDDLSLQVHPGDDYARVNENGSMGKTEFWYILDCKEGAEII